MNVLISDIDGTLLGDEGGLKAFNEYIDTIRDKIFLVYASGRSYEEYLSAIKHDGLIYPDAVITSTGADIYVKSGGGFELDESWHREINTDGWDVDKIRGMMESLPGLTGQTARNKYKASYYMSMTEQKELEKAVVNMIKKSGVGAKIIASHGIYLDILPIKCDKGGAARFLMNRLGFNDDNVIVAGDSENDVDLFMKFKHGIIVGNAHHAMKMMLKGGDYYEAKKHAASGLLEGLAYYAGKKVFKV